MSHSARVCASPQQTHEVTRLQDEIVATRARLTTRLRGSNEHTALFALLNALQLHVHNLRLAIKSDVTQCAERVRHSFQELRVARIVVDAVVKGDYNQAEELQRVPRPTVEETCTQIRGMVFHHFPEAEEAFRHTSRSSLSPERAWKVLQARMSLLGTKLAQPPAKPDADSPTQEDWGAFRTRILRHMQLRMRMPARALLGMTTCPLHLSRWAGVPPSEGASPDRLDRMEWEEGSWGEGYAHEVFRHGAIVDGRLGPFCPHYTTFCPEYADSNPCTLLYGKFTVVLTPDCLYRATFCYGDSSRPRAQNSCSPVELLPTVLAMMSDPDLRRFFAGDQNFDGVDYVEAHIFGLVTPYFHMSELRHPPLSTLSPEEHEALQKFRETFPHIRVVERQ